MTKDTDIIIHNTEDFEGMRKAGEVAAAILVAVEEYVRPGITTNYLDSICHSMILDKGAIPAPLNYRGFPKSICTSVNHVICHGIPSDKVLVNGDILNIDVTVIIDGWHGDTSKMFLVGNKVPIKASKLVEITYDCMMFGIEQVKPGVKFNQIGKVIQEHAYKHSYSVVQDYCGHGIGKTFHCAPNVLHYYDPTSILVMEEGMFFTIEPMINAGKSDTLLMKDGWTVVTRDRSLSAQFEHTIGVTSDGFEIFTKC